MSGTEHLFFWAAAAASVATLAAHVFLGGHLFARPLLASTLTSPVKHTLYYCWHLVSGALAVMAAAFVWAALADDGRAAAWLGAGLAAIFLVVNLTQNIAMGLSFVRHPQGAFFMTVTLLAASGLAYG